jgi:hypothetical protein
MKTLRSILCSAALMLTAACASVSTQIVELNPTQKYPPTENVEVLLQKPTRPHTQIALIESRGTSEAELLNDAREKAKVLGADAIVKLETDRIYHEPVPVYDPWYDPFYWPYYRRPFGPFYSPWGWGPYPWGAYPYAYRYVGGYVSYVLKSAAIRYEDTAATPAKP